jgi:hypothetical protein
MAQSGMIQFRKSITLGLWMLSAAAQVPAPQPLRSVDPDVLLRDSRWRELYDQQVERQAQFAAQQREHYEERQFLERVNHFAVLWNQLATEYKQKRAFNLKAAKELSKACRQLERTSAWPKTARWRYRPTLLTESPSRWRLTSS